MDIRTIPNGLSDALPHFDIDQRRGILMRRAHEIAAAVFERTCAGVGLTPAQHSLLTVLDAEPGIDQTRLSRTLAFDKVTVMRALKGLEDCGLVWRELSSVSWSQITVSLTPTGARCTKRQASRPSAHIRSWRRP